MCKLGGPLGPPCIAKIQRADGLCVITLDGEIMKFKFFALKI
jgi:hypothetical protein